MGKLNSRQEQNSTLSWAKAFRTYLLELECVTSLSQLKDAHSVPLKKYFALANLSRGKNAPEELVKKAWGLVFKVRMQIENSIEKSIKFGLEFGAIKREFIFSGRIFGASKKQGASFRMPLTTCHPTKLCSAACYAHDVLDAAPASVVRGVVNGYIAELYENSAPSDRIRILKDLTPNITGVIRNSIIEAEQLDKSWTRQPRIRFSHVGEIATYPQFANAIAKMVNDTSQGKVKCVLYTRRKEVRELDPKLWVINFTLDKSSMNRKKWIPKNARLVNSAFGGELAEDVEINFLEHHRWIHFSPVGKGKICPATAPDTKERSCDACKCDLCFQAANNS
jgi:hypothetical protein